MTDAPAGGAHPVASLLAGVRHRIAPEVGDAGERSAAEPDPQWDELATAVDELVEVVLVQQDLIENLLLRMSRLEGRDVTAGGNLRGA